MKKYLLFLLSSIILLAILSPFVSASDTVESLWDKVYRSIPDEIKEDIPKDGISAEALGPKYIFGKLSDIFFPSVKSAFSLLSKIISILLISSVSGLYFKDALGGKMRNTANMISTLTLACTVLSSVSDLSEKISAYVSSVTAFVSSMTPCMSMLLTASANTVGAAVTSSGFLLFSAVIEAVSGAVFIPLFKTLLAFSVTSSVTPSYTAISAVSSFFKRTFTLLLSAVGTVYITVLSYQSHIAAAADSLTARGIKFAVSSSIPIVGGAVGDAVRTASASLEVIKSSAGAVGIAVIILISAPILIELFISSAALGISAFAAGILGCDREASLLSETRSVLDFAIASVAVTVTVLLIATAIFMKTAPALAG